MTITAKRIAYLGPPGTFTEQAAMLHDKTAQLMPFPSVLAVAAVDTGMADEGVAAIENSMEGSVPETLDLLMHESRLVIRKELVPPIEHCLVVKRGHSTTRSRRSSLTHRSSPRVWG